MCGRYSLVLNEGLEERFEVVPPAVPIPSRVNVAPGSVMPVLVRAAEQRIIRLARWGLVPPWAKEGQRIVGIINARSETVAEKPSFHDAFRQRRCLVPASGFFEWKRDGSTKTPFYFHPASGGLMAFAGLSDEAGTFAILTTRANALMAPIHDRMPVVVSRSVEMRWIDPSTSLEELLSLLQPAPDDALAVHRVSSAVGNPRNEGVELLRRLE